MILNMGAKNPMARQQIQHFADHTLKFTKLNKAICMQHDMLKLFVAIL